MHSRLLIDIQLQSRYLTSCFHQPFTYNSKWISFPRLRYWLMSFFFFVSPKLQLNSECTIHEPNIYTLALAIFSSPAFASSSTAQFYSQSSKLGFALSSSQNGESTDLFFQMSAPQKAGWGAVGIGDRMDGAYMFIMYPSTDPNSTFRFTVISSTHEFTY